MQIGAICHMELMVKVLSPSYVNTYPSSTVYNKTNQTKILSGYLSQAASEDLIHHTTPGGRRKKTFQKVLKSYLIFRFTGHCIRKNVVFSVRNCRGMGHGMGQTGFPLI